MQKIILITITCILFVSNVFAQDIFINKDTTINDVWKINAGVIIKFGSKGFIKGKGTIKGGIIDAALTQWIFDTTLQLFPEATYGAAFSAKWFGAGKFIDNSYALQKSINTIIDNSSTLKNLYIPKGVYTYSKPLVIQSIYKGKYVGATIHMYGESAFWDCCAATTLKYTGTDKFALGLQVNKGSEINNIIIEGQFKAPNLPDSLYYNLPFEKFNDVGQLCSDTYAGLVIDYDGSNNESGSTGIKIHDVFVNNFTIDFLISPNGKTFNADILLFENIRCGNAKIGFATGQAQEKGNIIKGIYAWGNVHTLISIGRFGKAQAGNYTIDGGNIAGKCIRLFDISQSGWYSTTISNIFAESIASIGSISSQIPASINNCTFHFVLSKVIGKQILFTGNNNSIVFNTCIFRYYGSKDAMKFAGKATYNNCFFSGVKSKE
jgi:hypothetical protein